jgi:hypothetical protein
VTADDDVIQWLLREVVERIPGYAASGSNAILLVEQMARRHFGGSRPYISKRAPADRAGSSRRRDLPSG